MRITKARACVCGKSDEWKWKTRKCGSEKWNLSLEFFPRKKKIRATFPKPGAHLDELTTTRCDNNNHEVPWLIAFISPYAWLRRVSSGINKRKCNRKTLFRSTWQKDVDVVVARTPLEKCNKFPHIFRLIWMLAAQCAHTGTAELCFTFWRSMTFGRS